MRSILVPETKQDIVSTTTMKTLGGAAVEIVTDSTPPPVPPPAKELVDNVIENKFVAPVKTKAETSLKQVWKTFDPQLIKQPAAPTTIPSVRSNISVPSIDRVDPLKRQPVKDIY